MAVDAGSNATKYRVWEIDEAGHAELVAEQRFQVRLGEGVFTSGRLGAESIAAAVEVFKQITSDAGKHRVRTLRAVTTSAVREACNGQELVDAIRQATGIELEILADIDEARLIAAGILAGRPEGSNTVMVDIGGGSTELIVARGHEIEFAHSFQIGAVRMKEMFFDAIPPEPEKVEGLSRYVQEMLEDFELPRIDEDAELIGSGGTITSVVMMLRNGNGAIALEEVEEMIARLKLMSVGQIVSSFPVDEARAEIILAGTLVLHAMMKRVGKRPLTLVRGGVSDGLLREFLGAK